MICISSFWLFVVCRLSFVICHFMFRLMLTMSTLMFMFMFMFIMTFTFTFTLRLMLTMRCKSRSSRSCSCSCSCSCTSIIMFSTKRCVVLFTLSICMCILSWNCYFISSCIVLVWSPYLCRILNYQCVKKKKN